MAGGDRVAPGQPLERGVPGEARVLRVEVAARGQVEDERVAGVARDRDRLLPARRVLGEDQPHLPAVHVAPVVAAVDVADRRHRLGGLVRVDAERHRGHEGEDRVVPVHPARDGEVQRDRQARAFGHVPDQPPARLGPLPAAGLAPPALAFAAKPDDAVAADRPVLRPLVAAGDPDDVLGRPDGPGRRSGRRRWRPRSAASRRPRGCRASAGRAACTARRARGSRGSG